MEELVLAGIYIVCLQDEETAEEDAGDGIVKFDSVLEALETLSDGGLKRSRVIILRIFRALLFFLDLSKN